jgi:hypothetical protein
VLAFNEVLLKLVALAAVVVTRDQFVLSVDRSMRNPVSTPDLSVHDRLICVEEAAVAVKDWTAAGVVTLEAVTQEELPPDPVALIR